MRILAPAKINLSLGVSAPIKDGSYKNYHNLDSLVVFADFGDELFFELEDENSIEIKGEFAPELIGHDVSKNLIFKAINVLNQYCKSDRKIKVTLYKNLPIASGIGGGSSDCAASLIALNEIWQLGLSIEELINIGNEIGADIGVCIKKKPTIMRGIGDELTPMLILPRKINAILVNPLLECSTPLVYKTFDELSEFSQSFGFEYNDCPSFENLISLLKSQSNDLTKAAIKILPQIGEILSFLENETAASLVRMSGSGATCFALYESLELSKIASDKINSLYRQNGQKIWAKSCCFLGE